MTFDTLVANPGRLTILTALAVEPQQEFVSLRNRTKPTDGNLASHARRLASAGMLEIDKQLRGGKPVTTIKLTSVGRSALEGHVRRLMAALSFKRVSSDDGARADSSVDGVVDAVIAGSATPPTGKIGSDGASPSKTVRASSDDWVD